MEDGGVGEGVGREIKHWPLYTIDHTHLDSCQFEKQFRIQARIGCSEYTSAVCSDRLVN